MTTPVVWVTPEASASPRGGGGLRSVRLLQEVAARTSVHVVCLSQGVGDEAEFRDATGAASVRWIRPAASGATVRLRALRHGWAIDVARWYDPIAAKIVRDHVEQGCTVVAEHLRLTPYRVRGRPWVALLHNVDSEWHAAMRGAVGGRQRIEAAWDDRMLRHQEQRVLTEPEATVVAVSPRDADVLGIPCHVVPNGCDVPESVAPVRADGTLLFVGSLDYPPNRDAVRWWVDEIWSRMPVGSRPLTVVGRGSTGLPAGAQGIHLVGEVPDVAPHVASARAVLIPLREGSGTRLKLLEAMAWARPIVITSKGAEGIEVVDGVHVLIADDADAFARATERILDDHALAARLGAAGREVALRYDWRRIAPAFADLVTEAAAG